MVKKLIIRLSFYTGEVIGLLSLIIPPKLSYLFEQFRNGVYTKRNRMLFRTAGGGIILSPNIKYGNPQYMTIGENSAISKYCILEAYKTTDKEPKVTIGKNCQFGEFTHLTCVNNITIGDGVLTGRFVLITDNSHGASTKNDLGLPPLKRPLHTKGGVVIGNNVWVGDQAIILPGVTIGEGAIIAANAVVSENVPAFSVVGGVPAKVLKTIK